MDWEDQYLVGGESEFEAQGDLSMLGRCEVLNGIVGIRQGFMAFLRWHSVRIRKEPLFPL